MHIGFVSLGMSCYPLREVLRTAVGIGCEAMELNGRETVHNNLWTAPVNYAAIMTRISESGVTATSLGGYSDMAQTTDEDLQWQIEQFVGYCRMARAMDIPVVRAFAGDMVEGFTLDHLYPRIVAGFKEVMACVAGWGLTVGLENHGRLINHGDYLWSLLQDVGSASLGITLDTGNFCWAGHSIETAQRFFEKLAPRVVNVHVKDGKFVEGEFVLLPAGRGDLDLRGLLRTLKAVGYDGPVLSEFEGQGDFILSTQESVAHLKALRDELS
jgi:sugar phosphate isomerase/epimerase